MDCGPTCLKMITKYYGREYPLPYLREITYIGKGGVSLLGISDAAETLGFKTLSAKLSFEKLKQVKLPVIAHWMQNHFIIIYKIKRGRVYAADPAFGIVKYKEKEFVAGWAQGEKEGIILSLEPSASFINGISEHEQPKTGLKFFLTYLAPYKKYMFQVFLGVLTGSILTVIFPFLTQSLVDFGINNRSVQYITLILLFQLVIFISETFIEIIRNRLLLHIGTRINISIISDFLVKLMKLPLSFFDSKMIGDILQRISDHTRLQNFFTVSTFNIAFSILNILVFGIVLMVYNSIIFYVFAAGSIISVVWVVFFLRKRKEIDYKRFAELSHSQSSLVQLIYGMPEIKLNGSEKAKRWEWERIQAKLFKINIHSLTINQMQQAGAMFINQLKNITIIFWAAHEVVAGRMTLGMMLAVSYIIGQLNGPIDQMIGFLQATQDAKISLDRLSEIYVRKDEEEGKYLSLPRSESITISGLGFRYEGPHSETVLRNLTLEIPRGKVTAIVGSSGGGKTTLIKLLLKFYKPTEGSISLGDMNFSEISSKSWRKMCGVVMQDGYIFSDTIARNIAMGGEEINEEKLMHAARTANIEEFIKALPMGFSTKIGYDGHGLSQGQKQRLLIARAVYKDPAYLFFDEATSDLDANNEKAIVHNLNEFFAGRTVVVVAHRLSTVRSADKIAVLSKGAIVEAGTHNELIRERNSYYHLVKNQLELNNHEQHA
jgi:ATP-binding cassette subfamily B protein